MHDLELLFVRLLRRAPVRGEVGMLEERDPDGGAGEERVAPLERLDRIVDGLKPQLEVYPACCLGVDILEDGVHVLRGVQIMEGPHMRLNVTESQVRRIQKIRYLRSLQAP